MKDANERDVSNFLIFPFLLWRMLHNQIWISLSRYRTAKGKNRIVDKTIEFEQVDRERNWYKYIYTSLSHIRTYIHTYLCVCIRNMVKNKCKQVYIANIILNVLISEYLKTRNATFILRRKM